MPSAVVIAGEAMATVGKHSCGWGVLRLRVNGWIVLDQGRSAAEGPVGQGIRILMGRVLALFHGIVPPLGTPEANRVISAE